MALHNGYRTVAGEKSALAQLHPSCARVEADSEGLLPEWVVYHELVATGRVFLSKVRILFIYLFIYFASAVVPLFWVGYRGLVTPAGCFMQSLRRVPFLLSLLPEVLFRLCVKGGCCSEAQPCLTFLASGQINLCTRPCPRLLCATSVFISLQAALH